MRERHTDTHKVWEHDNQLKDYWKYFPHTTKFTYDPDTNERFSTRINNHGFRGDDFEIKKRKEVVRILTLGASSTFGYFNRDTTTYPYFMEHMLNERCEKGIEYEVINLGIPHFALSEIRALYLSEGIKLEPDIVTLYSGRNDSWRMLFKHPKPIYRTPIETSKKTYARKYKAIKKIYLALNERSVLIKFMDFLRNFFGRRDLFELPSEQFFDKKAEPFIQNVSDIYEASQNHGILFLAANQQASSVEDFIKFSKRKRKKRLGVTYEDEKNLVKQRVALKKSGATKGELAFLIHAHLMKTLRQWTINNGVPFVDIINALDNHRHYLVSWVHLNSEANKIIAAAFVEAILNLTCGKVNT